MRYKTLGSSDLLVSEVCLGTMTWGEQNSEEEAYEQLDYALSKGVNFIDTAEVYAVPVRPETVGKTEEIIGRWLKSRNVPREKVIIATKVCSAAPGREFITANRRATKTAAAKAPRLEPEQIRAAVEGSLRRLQLDYIDVYYLHWPDRYAPLWGSNQYRLELERDGISFEEQVKALGQLIKEGKIRYWALSNETTFGVCNFCETAKRLGVPLPIGIQNDFSLLDRRFESELAEACSPGHYNIGLLPYGPLAGGALSGKYLYGAKPEGARNILYPEFQPRYFAERSEHATEKYAALAKRKGLTPTQLALAWCASRWYVTSSIIGATKISQLKENIAAFDIKLDEDSLAEVDKIHMVHRNPNVQD